MNTMGKRLIFARKSRGYTQKSLAEAIGVSRNIILNIENNRTVSQPIIIDTICEFLNINKKWLIDDNGEMEKDSEAEEMRILNDIYRISSMLSKEEQKFILNIIKAYIKDFHN